MELFTSFVFRVSYVISPEYVSSILQGHVADEANRFESLDLTTLYINNLQRQLSPPITSSLKFFTS
jgi:hypothetical protein